MPVDPKSVRDLFLAVTELPATERAAYLQTQTNGDAELLAAVERLLAAHEQPASLLNRPAPGMPTAEFPGISERPGSMIGPYKLMEQIGEGGFGLVFVAEQTEPVKRKVAIKVIKPGMDSKQVIARFEAERQALAMMDHPNIARVLDAGTTETGRPYFVMELVRGIPITDYCDQNHLTPAERLELFICVCHAIQHAHQKGIIHRDIKPSNVLVTSHDGKPVAKVIDFGVAKAIHQHLTERTIYTQFAQMIGTPLYMSPEQAEMSGLDIDTRSDIYSLGVLLYELLTGSTPLERKRLAQAAYDEIRRAIREDEAQRPSDRLSTSDTLPSLAASRKTEPARLSRMLKGELDWIVLKALEKDRTRRYETANGFARDIQRYLSDEVVEARPASAGYRLRKLAARNKGKVLVAGLVLGALLVGMMGTTWGLVEAEKQKRLAMDEAVAKEDARQEAVKERDRAGSAAAAEKVAREQAQKRLTQIEKSNAILSSIFAELDVRKNKQSSEPLEAALAQRLVKAARQLEGDEIGDPLAVASLQNQLGVSLMNLGHPQEAIPLFIKAVATRGARLGSDHADTVDCKNNLALSYQDIGKLDLALPLFEEALRQSQASLGADHFRTLASMNNLAGCYQSAGKLERALELMKECYSRRRLTLGANHPDTSTSKNNLAEAYRAHGNFEQAIPLLEEAYADALARYGADHPETMTSQFNLAGGLADAGKLDRALPLFEENVRRTKARLGADHPDTLNSMNSLAIAYHTAGRVAQALPMFEESYRLARAKFGPDHPKTLTSMTNLAGAYQDSNRLDMALPLLEETLKLTRARLGADHPQTLNSLNDLALATQATGKLNEALPLLEECLRLRKAKLGNDHPRTLTSMNNLAYGLLAANRMEAAIALFEENLTRSKSSLGPQHPDTLAATGNLGMAYRKAGRLAEALPLLEKAHRSAKQHFNLRGFGRELLHALVMTSKTKEAMALVTELLERTRADLPKDSPKLAGQLASFGLSLTQVGAFTEAETLLRESLAIRESKEVEAWTTFHTKSLLGLALLGQKKYTDAEPLLLTGYEGLKQREKTIPQQGNTLLSEALDRLIRLYTETNKPDEVKKWQAEKEKISKTPEKK